MPTPDPRLAEVRSAALEHARQRAEDEADHHLGYPDSDDAKDSR